MTNIYLNENVTLPTHYSECSVAQFEAAASIVFQLQIKIGLRPELASLGEPNFKMIKAATKDDFKTFDVDSGDVVIALSDPYFIPYISDFAGIDTQTAELITQVYDQSLFAFFTCATAVMESCSRENLIKDGLAGYQSILIKNNDNSDLLSLKDTFEEYPTYLVANGILEPFEKGYDIRCFFSSFFANLLRMEDDVEVVTASNNRLCLNQKIVARNYSILQSATVKDLLNLYVFFCNYMKIQQLFYKAHLAILEVGKSVAMRQSTTRS